MAEEWITRLQPYQQTVEELKVKLRGMRTEFAMAGVKTPIEFVTGRVKTTLAIEEKAVRRHIDLDRLELDMEDLAGLRIMTQFKEDIYKVVDLLRERQDITILEERDYVSNPKPSGYQSYHIVIEYPLQLISGERKVLAEIQIRTLQMNVWATIEHALNYKNSVADPEWLATKLQKAAELSMQVDDIYSELYQHVNESKEKEVDDAASDLQ
ncbi:GTP pyrophosphokinase family protein [Weissella muntiaci]|uniref:GTP pyrophosphokinase family protein n=1 Tax=Weissella muntiaci TaxID=2508881 RepID=A0A6C2C1B4_9LACO|nr:GTP pyrophosphokinase family protein [Weissella muntiaci]TYC47778.1 GTP pyrophosphokinase family protein [Weissella muntiaci]